MALSLLLSNRHIVRSESEAYKKTEMAMDIIAMDAIMPDYRCGIVKPLAITACTLSFEKSKSNTVI